MRVPEVRQVAGEESEGGGYAGSEKEGQDAHRAASLVQSQKWSDTLAPMGPHHP